MTTLRIAKIVKEKTQAKWFDCVRAANEIQIGLIVKEEKQKQYIGEAK